jgi:ribosome assembly protein 1
VKPSVRNSESCRLLQFAALYASKLGASEKALRRALWGDRYYHPKSKKILGKKASGGRLKPMFAQFVLEPLWQAYGAILDSEEGERVERIAKIVKAMNLTVPARDLQHKDARVALQAVMSRWVAGFASGFVRRL